jgi:ACR3 family arsenite transporter
MKGIMNEKLSWISRYLTFWILLAMAVGIITGAAYPEIANILDAVSIEQVSLPIAIGLIWMMYPPLAGVKYEELSKMKRQGKALSASIVQNCSLVLSSCSPLQPG